MAKPIEIHARLSADAFRRYCAFDAFRRRRRWLGPVAVGMALVTLSLGGVLRLIPMSDRAAGVLMGLGIAAPLFTFGLYAIQIEARIADQGLKDAPEVYALYLTDDGVRVTNSRKAEPPVDLEWARLWAAFRRRDAVYLYAAPDRAFILPNGMANVPDDAVWDCVRKNLGAGRCAEGTLGNRH